MDSGMVNLQIYASKDLKERLLKRFGEGRVSANIERILRHHLENSMEEKKLRLKELNIEIRRFNSDFQENAELIFNIKEAPPKPPEEKEG